MISGMVSALVKAVVQLTDPAFWRVLWKALVLTVAVFAGLVFLAWVLFADLALVDISWLPQAVNDWLNGIIEWLARSGVVLLVFLFFPALATLFVSLFLDDIASAVEARHYPRDPPGSGLALGPSVLVALQFAGVIVLANLVALPFYLLTFWFPPLSAFIFYGLNGYLLGREYFELVALRHLPGPAARQVRWENRGRILLGGVVVTFLLTIPVVNLVAPILATAFMVHVFKGLSPKGRV